jgi:serine/threonine-protein kinase
MQDDIAARVSDGLRMSLTGAQRQALARRDTTNDEAYRLYLHGRYYWYRLRLHLMDTRRACPTTSRRLPRDPRYALAYLGLADTYVSMAVDGWMPP